MTLKGHKTLRELILVDGLINAP